MLVSIPIDNGTTQKELSFSDTEFREFVIPGRALTEITEKFGEPLSIMEEEESVIMTYSNRNTDLMGVKKNYTHKLGTYNIVFKNDVVESFNFNGFSVYINY